MPPPSSARALLSPRPATPPAPTSSPSTTPATAPPTLAPASRARASATYVFVFLILLTAGLVVRPRLVPHLLVARDWRLEPRLLGLLRRSLRLSAQINWSRNSMLSSNNKLGVLSPHVARLHASLSTLLCSMSVLTAERVLKYQVVLVFYEIPYQPCSMWPLGDL